MSNASNLTEYLNGTDPNKVQFHAEKSACVRWGLFLGHLAQG